MTVRLLGTWCVAVVFLLSACSSKTKVESDLNVKGAPDWVNKGTHLLNDKNGRLFHGVGSAPNMGDISLQSSTADERARAEVARMLSSYLKVGSKDYSVSASRAGEMANELSVSRDIENLTRINLAGARIIGRWTDKRTGLIWSIAELDINRMKETMRQAEEVTPALRTFLANESESIFDQMLGDKK